jgi:hypothetical protein
MMNGVITRKPPNGFLFLNFFQIQFRFFDKIACDGMNINTGSMGFGAPFGPYERAFVNLYFIGRYPTFLTVSGFTKASVRLLLSTGPSVLVVAYSRCRPKD